MNCVCSSFISSNLIHNSYINSTKLNASTCFGHHPPILRRSMSLIIHVCSLWCSRSLQVAVLCTCWRETARPNKSQDVCARFSWLLYTTSSVTLDKHSPPYRPDLAPCDFRLFPKLKSPLKLKRNVNATVTQYTSSVNSVSLLTD